jgi:cytochrome c556
MNMIRMLCGIVVIGIATSAATAQQDPIAARKALMKENGDQAKIGAAMAKSETPFDLAKAHKIFATFQDNRGQGARFVSRESNRPADGG